MYNFTTPKRGEPLDLTMMSQMSQYINEINAKLLESKSANSSLEAPVRLKVGTEDVTIWTGKTLVAQNINPVSSIKDLKVIDWYSPFDITFRSIPVVTATPFCNSTKGTVSPNACWIEEVTTNGVKGKFRFIESPKQTETVYVMVIAIGQGQVA